MIIDIIVDMQTVQVVADSPVDDQMKDFMDDIDFDDDFDVNDAQVFTVVRCTVKIGFHALVYGWRGSLVVSVLDQRP